jgi:hypothetical protein
VKRRILLIFAILIISLLYLTKGFLFSFYLHAIPIGSSSYLDSYRKAVSSPVHSFSVRDKYAGRIRFDLWLAGVEAEILFEMKGNEVIMVMVLPYNYGETRFIYIFNRNGKLIGCCYVSYS